MLNGEISNTPAGQPTTSLLSYQRQILDLLRAVSLDVGRAETMDDALRGVLTHVCRFMDWPLGHAYLWSDEAGALVSSRVWYVANPRDFATLREASEKHTFNKGEGGPGKVVATGRPVTWFNIPDSAQFLRSIPAEEEQVQAYFAFPVATDGTVTAVLEFFAFQPAEPDAQAVDVIQHVTTLLALAMRQQQALLSLQRSEARLAEAQWMAHVGYWEWDVSNNQVNWSPELHRIFGLPVDEVDATYEDYLERMHPDDLEMVRDSVQLCYREGMENELFCRIVRPDGAQRVLNMRLRPVFDEQGQVILIRGTAMDMTEQKEAERKLAQTVDRLSALIEISQALVATLELPVIYDRVLEMLRPLVRAEAVILLLHEGEEMTVVAMKQGNIVDSGGDRMAINSSVAGRVWHSGESMLLTGEKLQRWVWPHLSRVTGYRPQAMLAAPLRWQDTTVGVLEAVHRHSDAFTTGDLALMETAAAWTTIAIINARQYAQLQRRVQESDAIAEISRALAETLDLDEVLNLIVETTQRIIPQADWATIHLFETKRQRLELAAAAGLTDPGDYELPANAGVAGRVLAEGGVRNVPDLQADEQRLPIDEQLQIRSLLVAPVESRLQRIGVISVQCSTPGAFVDEDERLLKVLGVQAGMAIENANLYTAQLQARQLAERQRERMRHMAQRVLTAQEEERARIARELHDEAGQSLTSLKISLDLLQMTLPEELTDTRESLNELIGLVDTTMNNLRLLSHNLRPPGLDAYGLDAALSGLCQDIATHTALNIAYEGAELPGLPSLLSLTLYRVAQEALTNVVRHAGASRVTVSLVQEDGRLALSVADDGCGFDPSFAGSSPAGKGAGLVGMQERVEMVRGELLIDSRPGNGSRLTAIVPLTEDL